MGRSRKDIKQQITASFIANQFIIEAYGLVAGKTFEEQFSLVSFENILFDIISYSIYLLELLFVKHEKDTDEKLHNQKSGRLPWYRTMALQFQYGFDLITDLDYFDNTGATGEEIEASKIIKYAAVADGEEKGTIIIKVAGETDSKLAPITPVQQNSVEAYFEEIKWGGTYVTIINFLPDRLYLNIQIFRDPLLLDENGTSKRYGGRPVEAAIQEFMKELPFDGELTIQSLTDKLQLVEGVKIANVVELKSSWIDPELNGYGQETTINVKRIPESGYFEIVNFDNITYVE